MSVFQVHPMCAILMHAVVIWFESTVFGTQFIQFLDVLPCALVSIVSVVLPSHLKRKSYVSDIVEFDFIGMPCHHGGTGQPIGHSWSHVVHPISSRRVASDEYFVGIDKVVEDEAPDDDGEEFLEVIVPPHVPLVLAGPWNKPNYSLRQLIIVKV